MTTQGSGRTTPEPAEHFARVEDGFERLWTPHRMAYIKGEKPSDDAGTGCPFCAGVSWCWWRSASCP